MLNSISSINAHSSWLNSNANNISNVNTDNFIPTQTNLNESENGVKAISKKADDSGAKQSQTDITKEIPEQIIIGYGFEANALSVKTYDEMMGTVLDLKV